MILGHGWYWAREMMDDGESLGPWQCVQVDPTCETSYPLADVRVVGFILPQPQSLYQFGPRIEPPKEVQG